jgi:hypothetical protein
VRRDPVARLPELDALVDAAENRDMSSPRGCATEVTCTGRARLQGRRAARATPLAEVPAHRAASYAARLLDYAAFLERKWNRAKPPERRVESLELVELDGPWDANPAQLPRTVLWP